MTQFPWLETRRLRARGYSPRVYQLMMWRQTTLLRLAKSSWTPWLIGTWALWLFDNVEAVPERRSLCV